MRTSALTVSYRCPTSVVEFAQQWVDHIEPAPTADTGEVQKYGNKWDTKDFQPNDLVVCRTTKPLISLGYKFLRERIPARIMGKEIGQGLKSLITKINARGVDQLITKLAKWETRECEKAIAKKQDGAQA